MTKVALVTGGTRGIGAAISLALKKEGCNVAATYSSNSDAANKFSSENGIEVFQWNVADAAACEAGVKQVEEKLGAVDILVNNAGITKDGLLMRMTEEAWDAVMEVNLKSCFNVVKAALRPMMKQRSGSIINVSSIVGVKGNAGQANYAASKSGISGFTKSLAQEVGSRGVTVNCIAPGFIDTEMTQSLPDDHKNQLLSKIPLGKLGTPEDIANAVIFLASSHSDYINGETLHVNGGLYMA